MGLLPSYLENGDSSLVQMVNHFSESNNEGQSFFFLDDFDALRKALEENSEQDLVLFGVTFALLDFAGKYSTNNSRLQVVFTGGMKNRREELSFEDIHEKLKEGFPQSKIISEYGMTELLSQAYSDQKGHYKCGATMRVVPMEVNDPLTIAPYGKTAQLGIMDLANFDTLSFILTEDAGRVMEDGRFEILGRLEQSDLRGCNLLYSEI